MAAQETLPAPELPPPPPPPSAEPSPAVAPAVSACVPACRAGYLCAEGQCVSACNPPCLAGEQCAANGECVMDLGSTSAPRTPQSTPPAAPSFFGSRTSTMPKPNPGKERHDGFMLRLALGLGSNHVNGSAASTTSRSLSLSFDIGGAPVENLVIHFRMAEAFSSSDTSNGVTALLYAPAVTYYLMPLNFYLTGAVGLSALLDDANQSGTVGPGLNLDAGKEWWVSDNWGFGGALRFWYAHGGRIVGGTDVAYDFFAWAILFSATYQ